MADQWRFWIDRGGTFTDCIGRSPDGRLSVTKVLSSDEAPLEGIRALLELPEGAPIPPCEVRMGTTLATNALLTRSGASTTLFVTEGFEDLLEIDDQTRPDLFALDIERPSTLAARTVGVPHRADPRGATLEAGAGWDCEASSRSAAVVVMHGPRAPDLERAIGERCRAAGFSHVSLSHEVDAEQGLLARAHTTVADAYLTPLLTDYLAHLAAALPGSRLLLMQSSGALTEAARFRGRDAVLSGPAGGVVALGAITRRAGLEAAIGFDMGGTSTDVSRFAREPERVYEARVAGVKLRAPMMAIHTVAAGGGSICRADGARLSVGPESAGAEPGPIAYGRGGAALTLTDVNVALGRVDAARFPFPLDEAAARAALARLAERLGFETPEALGDGFLEVATEAMAEAIRRVSVARGHDARDHALVVFGGAGGQHACDVARRLGIRTVLCHPLAGVLSALGMGVADEGWNGEGDAAGLPVDASLASALEPLFTSLEARGREALPDPADAPARETRRVDLRYAGTRAALTLAYDDDPAALREAFEREHRATFGYAREGHAVEVATARLERLVERPAPEAPRLEPRALPEPAEGSTWFVGEGSLPAPRYRREDLGAGARLEGPALVSEATGALVVPPGFTLDVDAEGLITLTDTRGVQARAADAALDPVRLAVLSNAFMSIAEQMGAVLQRTALSTNIRDRLDFSCALFDREARLVANAPHIPVHLGAMGETVAAVHRAHPHAEPGDVFCSNDPAAGGSHLPDITVVSPIHDADGALRFFVASRGHHADVGGITPGSMPPYSRRLDEEGVVFRAQRIVRAGAFDRAGVLATLRSGAYPARRPEANVADLEAQAAANQKGASLLAELVARYGEAVVSAYMAHVQDDASDRVQAALRALPDGARTFEDALDDGAPIRVSMTIRGGALEVDFAGSSPELVDDNLNAPRAITVAALMYVLRCLAGAEIPLNAGCLRTVSLRVPEGSVLDPGPERAVAAGNVETSQRVVDVLLGALGVAAASQGTMNNVTFGDGGFGYYETLGGGAGATAKAPGASCVHTHMTNSRITDPEVLEDGYPVRLRRFARRHGSGGEGAHAGGDGLVREYEVLAPLSFSILSERRARAPFGLAGGGPGERGVNRRGAQVLGGRVQLELGAGERITVETPGGGGWG